MEFLIPELKQEREDDIDLSLIHIFGDNRWTLIETHKYFKIYSLNGEWLCNGLYHL
jgi:hypothetical protein